MERTLIIHHLEPMWQQGYESKGTSFERLVGRLEYHLERNNYDRVILTRFEDSHLDEAEYEFIRGYVNQVEQYGYGWEASEREEQPDRFCEGGTHSEAVLLEDWMRLDGEVFICGAFDGECIEDLEIALRFLGVQFTRIPELIV